MSCNHESAAAKDKVLIGILRAVKVQLHKINPNSPYSKRVSPKFFPFHVHLVEISVIINKDLHTVFQLDDSYPIYYYIMHFH